jgi:phospholipid/cholesterol/gamma-HCH transport system ATP-binding protein
MELLLEGVSFFYGNRAVVNEASLAVSPGRTTVIIGASGSGKSMLLKVIAGLLPPHRGRVRWNGKNIFSFSEAEELEFRKRSSFVFQDAALWANRSVLDNVQFPLELHFPEISAEDRRKKVLYYLDKVGYQDSIDYRPDQLSMGEQKMVSLARALITEPELLFLDSPLVGIDSNSAEPIKKIIKEIRSQKRTILASFLDPELISMIADDLVVIHQGKVLIHGSFDQVKRSGDPVVQKILAMILEEVTAYDDDILSILDNGGIL